MKNRKAATNKSMEVIISHVGTPKGIRTSMTTGEVNGINEPQNAIDESGFFMADDEIE